MQILIYYLAFEMIINCNICKSAERIEGKSKTHKSTDLERKNYILYYDIVFIK